MITRSFAFGAILVWGACAGSLLSPSSVPAQGENPQELARRVKEILKAHCYRCHGQNSSNEGGFGFVLDFKQLVGTKVVPGESAKSRLFKRLAVNKDMPPEDEQRRPSDADIGMVKRWIEAGAPAPDEVGKPRPFRGIGDELRAIRDYLQKTRRADRPYIRFFTLTHLHNASPDKVQDSDLRVYQAALSKLTNSLSWKRDIVIPEAADADGTVFAVDVRKLDWDRNNLWQEVLKLYPYGLTHETYPDHESVSELAREVHELAGTDLPAVRADWFIATASRPPLYHTLLRIPKEASVLEKSLQVNVQDNFRQGKLARAGFNRSGVSGNNRLVERHDALHGAYWKSYDFKSSAGQGNLFVVPLGPTFPSNPFTRHAFAHDGGEIIFNLPNGLQGYMLVDSEDRRIDAGPIEVVSDTKRTSGTPQVVNGLSCMACHQHGIIPVKDKIRDGSVLAGDAGAWVRELHPSHDTMDLLVKKDEKRFLDALMKANAPFLNVGADGAKDVRDFPESVSAIARWYLLEELGLEEAVRELRLQDSKLLQEAVRHNRRLRELGLFPLERGGTVKREVWEDLNSLTSPFQEAARELKQGTPKRIQ
jgi:mono/diheme cytochrome c family protein